MNEIVVMYVVAGSTMTDRFSVPEGADSAIQILKGGRGRVRIGDEVHLYASVQKISRY